MQIQHDETAFLLTQWGRWAFINRELHLGYPNATPFRRLAKTTSSASPAITDLVATEVDFAVSQVCASNDEVGAALVRRYLLGEDYIKIGRRLGCSRQRASRLVKIGEAAVGEVLDAH